jgi:hypothetical protein
MTTLRGDLGGMARKLRVEYSGVVYRVMNRGDRREPNFRDDEDRRRFLSTLGEACGKAGWHVHEPYLRPNHFHLVVETRRPNLSEQRTVPGSFHFGRARHGRPGQNAIRVPLPSEAWLRDVSLRAPFH